MAFKEEEEEESSQKSPTGRPSERPYERPLVPVKKARERDVHRGAHAAGKQPTLGGLCQGEGTFLCSWCTRPRFLCFLFLFLSLSLTTMNNTSYSRDEI